VRPTFLKRHLSDDILVVLTAAAISIAALIHYFRSGELLLYGDAVAHINIARRVVDSMTPGPLQLGTVWLPLPHILMLPFVVSDWAWTTGFAGAIVSMLAYIAGSAGLFKLARLFMSRTTAWIALLIFAANPNLVYMQTTGMTESLFLAMLIWSALFFCKYEIEVRERRAREAARSLLGCGLMLSAAILTRYDGWFLAAITAIAAIGICFRAQPDVRQRLRRPLIAFVLLLAAMPTLWLAYNYEVFGNALEFLNGPYSARAIQQQTSHVMGSRHPGDHDLRTAKSFYIKAAELTVGEGRWQYWMFGVALCAGVIALLQKRRRAALLLWLPLPFYVLSIAYGSVPIFIPEWWPHSYVNVRYALQLLPAIAIFFALAIEMGRQINYSQRANRLVAIGGVVIVTISLASVWIAVPICLREARANSIARVAVESALAAEMKKLPPSSTLMMFTGRHGGALQRAGIPLRRVLNEGNYPDWDRALKAPSSGAEYIVACDKDLVAQAVERNRGGLQPIFNSKLEGEEITLYRSTQHESREHKP
jgi:dolichyl-phosphate-mannose-protein mannosyltransferase